ncbi:MAG: hypothetical protein KVP17_003288 [Porospora cf. gigantea B]|uniref:uncharacterized protein n=1 Tax=Porospora cf. gigantea B TaxID=2853592 RepID=UPI0035719B02|nr:MAG: hypothetical protein KVP17_003288 [Porospora cf. gigantea B]
MPANVAIQVVPDQPHKLTKTDFLDILSDANREVYKVVQGIEQDLANRAEVLEKLSSCKFQTCSPQPGPRAELQSSCLSDYLTLGIR